MSIFSYKNHKLCVEDIELVSLAHTYQTPLYVYSQSLIEENFAAFDSAFQAHPHLICYAVKANSNLAVLNTLARLGAGFDIVSGGELRRVLAAGGQANKCVFSGVGKTVEEIIFALEQGIYCFNVESRAELLLIEELAQEKNCIAPISLRVNPNVDAKTHPYISTGLSENKFGIATNDALELYQYIAKSDALSAQGIDCHIGSQITDKTPFLDALDKVLLLVQALQQEGISLTHIDLGGGVGIDYENNATIDIAEYVADIISQVGNTKIILEPGRAIVGKAGVMLTTVEFTKENEGKHFAIVDGAMNDLLRPSLYQAYHNILPTTQTNNTTQLCDIVGPVCETGDYFGKNRELAVQRGDVLAIMDVGAYGFVMSSNYNTRPMAAEVMVKGNRHKLVRKRQDITDLFALEESDAINE